MFVVMVRDYDMTSRRQAAQATRTDILEAAHRLLNDPDGGELTLQDVAHEAGVSRATIYNSIGSRRDVLNAVFVDQGRLLEYDRVLAAMRHADPRAAVVATVRESCRAWGVMPVAIRRTLALAVLDAEIGELVARFEGYRREAIRSLVRRLINPSPLRGSRDEEVTHTLSLLTAFPAYDHLCRALGPAGATAQLVLIAGRLTDTRGVP